MSRDPIPGMINRLLDEDRLAEADRILTRELKESPEDHWLLHRLSTVRYEMTRYGQALRLADRALALAPSYCGLAIFARACALDMLGRKPEALGLLRGLLARGAARLAGGYCGEGRRAALELLNDARYRIAIMQWEIGNRGDARRWLRAWQRRRQSGEPSIYSRRTVRRYLRELDQEIAESRRRKDDGRAP